MRRYRVEVSGTTYVIDVDEVSAEEFRVRVEGRDFSVRLSAPEDIAEAVISPPFSRAALAHEGDPPGSVPSPAQFRPAPPDQLASMVPSAPPPLPPPPDRVIDGGRNIKAPMPGKITSISVTPGSTVRTGDVLLTLEAMKMINAIKSPRSGRIADVVVQAGESVGYGQLLVTFGES